MANPRLFLRIWIISVVGLAVLVVLINLLVDPYDVFGTPRIAGINFPAFVTLAKCAWFGATANSWSSCCPLMDIYYFPTSVLTPGSRSRLPALNPPQHLLLPKQRRNAGWRNSSPHDL